MENNLQIKLGMALLMFSLQLWIRASNSHYWTNIEHPIYFNRKKAINVDSSFFHYHCESFGMGCYS